LIIRRSSGPAPHDRHRPRFVTEAKPDPTTNTEHD
jgi:hypothetical protein